MASLTPSVTSGSVSSLLKSASSLAKSQATFQDQQMADEYSLSAYTDAAFSKYQDYLNTRIGSLNAAGDLASVEKATSLQMRLIAANHSNISASIARENIAIIGGNANDTDKLNLIATQFTRAESIGDDTLAQSLMGQYYTLSQKIQYDQQQAASAGQALAKASSTAAAQHQGDVVSNLHSDIATFEAVAKKGNEGELNTALASYVKSKADSFAALGVKINTQQPNYFDVVSGIVGAIYNARVLQAIAELPVNPSQAAKDANLALQISTGQVKYDTLGGPLSLQEIQQASQDPAMYAYNGASGTYNKTAVVGYQYQNFTGYHTVNNQAIPYSYKALVPQYSGIVGNGQRNKQYFLTPTQVTNMNQLGLQFAGNNKKTNIGDGVTVQTTNNSPQWLKDMIAGKSAGSTGDQNASTIMYTDQQGSLIFRGASTTGEGNSFFTLMKDTAGKFGVFEHNADGTITHGSSDFGFNWGAASLLVNAGAMLQTQIKLSTDRLAAAAKITIPTIKAPAPPTPNISVPKPVAPAAHINIGGTPSNAVTPRTVNPQVPTVNPQQPASINLQGGGGIRLQ